ncbi:putative branched-chain-amino-acid aminotransferase [Nitrosotalea sinensis]|jgi:branched-chain amino acid aminotransferase|uniref:Branched-chain-amino-acid aminotransferase n=1 Tax=Nitrosotalea sinensis TaxID=1499975 RepID=A0A2H1EFV7_9ARCH|nr:branched-chain amino acid transaminase [Candidatus Nitrosotalea sinensis]SHO44345.1 putative branched-chain-amino-acid aminotransferase [Candidatus Nitrosotalea sinensis]
MKSFTPKFVWFDGKIIKDEDAKVPVMTHAIHYGTSVFEGLRGYWNSKNLNIFRLQDHIKRFRNSGKVYSISLKFTDKEIADAIIQICKKNNVRESCYIRPFYFVGRHGINLHVTEDTPTHAAIVMFPFGELFNRNGIKAGISSWRRINDVSTPPLAKMGGNYLNSILATQESKRNGYDEAILLDYLGNISEAPGENIFIVRDKKLLTPPPSSSALEGITKDSVVKIAENLGYQVVEREIPRTEIYFADEVFLTGTAAEITPVISIDGKKIGEGIVGKTTDNIRKIYSDITMGKNKKYSRWITPVY